MKDNTLQLMSLQIKNILKSRISSQQRNIISKYFYIFRTVEESRLGKRRRHPDLECSGELSFKIKRKTECV